MKKRVVGYCRIYILMQVDSTSLKDQEDKISTDKTVLAKSTEIYFPNFS